MNAYKADILIWSGAAFNSFEMNYSEMSFITNLTVQVSANGQGKALIFSQNIIEVLGSTDIFAVNIGDEAGGNSQLGAINCYGSKKCERSSVAHVETVEEGMM